MNHLRKFELENDYLQAKDSFVYPNVSYIVEKDILHYMKNSKYDFVDLGLPSGLQWAAWNVGATKPEESGLYFAWGEDKGYVVTRGEVINETYCQYNAIIKNADGSETTKRFSSGYTDYKHYDVSTSSFTKYNETDRLTILANEDDGCYFTENAMRMPTKAECEELIANTNHNFTDNYDGRGVSGMTFTSKTNGNSIFVPAVGGVNSGVLGNFGLGGFFWSSSLSSSSVERAFVLDFGSDYLVVGSGGRFGGIPLRAVRP